MSPQDTGSLTSRWDSALMRNYGTPPLELVSGEGVVVTDDRDASGPIAIQHHGEAGATYRFRNLRIKELKK